VPLGAEPQEQLSIQAYQCRSYRYYTCFIANFGRTNATICCFGLWRLWQEQPDIHLVMTGGRPRLTDKAYKTYQPAIDARRNASMIWVMWMMHSLS